MQTYAPRISVCAVALVVAVTACAATRAPEVRPPAAGPQSTSAQATTPAGSQTPAKPATTAAPAPTTPAQAGQGAPPQQQTAGQSAKPPQQPVAPQPPPSGQKPTFKVQVDLITTDVIPRDPKGQFVPDLTRDDFEVLEDGVKQNIVSMDLIRGGRHTNLVAPPAQPAEEGILLPTSRAKVDTSGRILIFFIDDLHIEFKNTARLRKLMEQMETSLIHEGDLIAIQTTGPSSVAVDLTYDKKRFTDATKRISGSELKPSEIINGPESADGPSEVRYRAHVAFSTVNDMLLTLDQVHDRRKALIYVSDGYDFNPFSESRKGEDPNGIYEGRLGQDRNDPNADPWEKQGQQFADADLVRELADLTRTANRVNVTMYTIDPRGLVGGPDLDEQVDPVEWQDYLHKAQDSLRVLAEQTGGIAVVNQNDFTKALQRIDAETSDYYMLGYYSSNPDPTKRYRSIEVKVSRPNVNVTARKGYQLKRPPKAPKTGRPEPRP